eukprot:CAMPEP_0184697022 /NCGR_PEP_ID=MMETSP0313-20130426/4144_1 /TAXON_ID=2792 /ORGANISM="Porphyridium aerugineum, Strain SAG 1380-2" /LENGTH=128 /DNA_ID=CAMNT_0027155783 /DNA_START=122 /DNA_END=508 /DNA_ORIENTATION=-
MPVEKGKKSAAVKPEPEGGGANDQGMSSSFGGGNNSSIGEGQGSVGAGGAGGTMSMGDKRRAATGDFERQVEEIRQEAQLVRENLAAAERALAEAGVLRAQQVQQQQGAGAVVASSTQESKGQKGSAS